MTAYSTKDGYFMYYDALILGLIMAKPLHGYEIKGYLNQFNQYINGNEISNNTIYPLLAKFEKHGITTKEVIVQDGKPSKTLHAITEQGRRYFYENINTIKRSTITSREEFCIRIVFFPAITPANRRELLDQRATHLRASMTIDDGPLDEWPMVREGFDLSLSRTVMVPFYDQLLTSELEMIERYRAHIDDPCTVPEDLLALV